MLYLRSKGRQFETHRRPCVIVSLIKTLYTLLSTGSTEERERSVSVVECLTRDRRVAGLSLTGVSALCS